MNSESSKKRRNDKPNNEKLYSHLLTITPEQIQKIRERKDELIQENVPEYWKEPISTIHWVPVEGGEIRVLHIKPKKLESTKPIVFISGWQTMPYQFTELYKIIHNRVEFYFIETREKFTSKIKRKKTDLSLTQKAKDVQKVIEYFNLSNKDFVLFGTCWGAAIIFQGLLDKTLKAPTFCTFSPMHKLWFNKFLLNYIVPFLPAFLISILMKLISYVLFIGEKAETQKNRMQLTMKEGTAWKWKKAARAAKDFELFGKLNQIEEKVFVISGTDDRVHKIYDYPRFADELQNGRFFYFGFEEFEREIMMGVLIYELAKITSKNGIPEFFKDYEIKF